MIHRTGEQMQPLPYHVAAPFGHPLDVLLITEGSSNKCVILQGRREKSIGHRRHLLKQQQQIRVPCEVQLGGAPRRVRNFICVCSVRHVFSVPTHHRCDLL
jgi:hypothetical protein